MKQMFILAKNQFHCLLRENKIEQSKCSSTARQDPGRACFSLPLTRKTQKEAKLAGCRARQSGPNEHVLNLATLILSIIKRFIFTKLFSAFYESLSMQLPYLFCTKGTQCKINEIYCFEKSTTKFLSDTASIKAKHYLIKKINHQKYRPFCLVTSQQESLFPKTITKQTVN